MGKVPLKRLLVALGFFREEEEALRWIMAGKVLVNTEPVDKPGLRVDPKASLRIRGIEKPYVSRGGLKLAHALTVFKVPVVGKVVIDVGACEGGFTDCLLQHGARLVYAVDVARNRLAWKLRSAPQVVNLEGHNIGDLSPGELDPAPEMATIDVTYLAVSGAIAQTAPLLPKDADILALIKPMFELRTGETVVCPDDLRASVVSAMEGAERGGCRVLGLDHSPILGGRGAAEFLLWARKGRGPRQILQEHVEACVAEAVEQITAYQGRACSETK